MLTRLKNLAKRPFTSKSVSDFPGQPGIYIFWDGLGNCLYVGKSLNLRARVKSYLGSGLSPKTAKMVELVKSVSYIQVTSELEALLLEAKVVRTIQPTYNIALKDDKSPLYIKITNEKYPQVIMARKIEQKEKLLGFYGPFTAAKSVKSVLKTLRKIFPFAQHKVGKKPCIYSQIGLCKPCPSEIEKTESSTLKTEKTKEYKRNINFIRRILSGSINIAKLSLLRNMKMLSRKEHFEEAQSVKHKLEKLEYITKPPTQYMAFLENPNLVEDIRFEEEIALRQLLSKHLNLKSTLSRIECFDIAHLQGSNPTASMVTFLGGVSDKNFYRHFKIEKKRGGDDIASLKEVAERRIKHFADWKIPDLIIVDGGKAQVGIFWGVLKAYSIPIVGLAKRFETLVIPKVAHTKLRFVEIKVPRGPALNLITRIRDEAHRFARRYHHKLIEKDLFN